MKESIDLKSQLRQHGHKLTTQRAEVWEVLKGAPGHLTAEQVAADTASGVNLASVYRALGLFTDIGIARESRLGNDDAARWEVAHPDDEFHIVCRSCGRVEHHGGDLVQQIRTHLSNSHGFEAATVELAVSGECSRCSDPSAA